MSAFPNGWTSRSDARMMLEAIDGRADIELGEWDIDDFANERSTDPAIERCRLRVRDELIELLTERDERKISALTSELISDLDAYAGESKVAQ